MNESKVILSVTATMIDLGDSYGCAVMVSIGLDLPESMRKELAQAIHRVAESVLSGERPDGTFEGNDPSVFITKLH